MINALYYGANQTIFGIIADGIPELFYTITDAVHNIAKNILIQVITSFFLCYLHHNCFLAGFVIGFIFDKQVTELVAKVNIVYSAVQTMMEKLFYYVGGGFFAIATQPASLIIATFYYSAQWGALLYEKSVQRYQKIHPTSHSIIA